MSAWPCAAEISTRRLPNSTGCTVAFVGTSRSKPARCTIAASRTSSVVKDRATSPSRRPLNQGLGDDIQDRFDVHPGSFSHIAGLPHSHFSGLMSYSQRGSKCTRTIPSSVAPAALDSFYLAWRTAFLSEALVFSASAERHYGVPAVDRKSLVDFVPGLRLPSEVSGPTEWLFECLSHLVEHESDALERGLDLRPGRNQKS